MDGPAETSNHEAVGPTADVSSPGGPALGHLPVPFQVFQQEEEGDEVGVGQGAEQVHHAVFLGSRV